MGEPDPFHFANSKVGRTKAPVGRPSGPLGDDGVAQRQRTVRAPLAASSSGGGAVFPAHLRGMPHKFVKGSRRAVSRVSAAASAGISARAGARVSRSAGARLRGSPGVGVATGASVAMKARVDGAGALDDAGRTALPAMLATPSQPRHRSAAARGRGSQLVARGTPRRPARSCTYCQAVRPERAPRVVAHSSASGRHTASSTGMRWCAT